MTSPAPFGPVRKIRWLTGAAGRGELSRADLAVLIVLADHVNSDTGKAWPAYPRLASTAGVSVRTAKRAITRLTALNLVTIAEHGGPGRSNRYGLNWPLFEATGDGDIPDTMQPTMVSPVTTYGDKAVTDIVPLLTPNPINPSEHKAKDEIDRSQADGADAAAPLGACDLPPAGKSFAAFWAAWGRRVKVAETERLIDAAIDTGANMADIVAGAERFQRYCTDTGKPARMTPAAFVKGQKWRDDWQLIRNPKAEAEKPKAQPAKGEGNDKMTERGYRRGQIKGYENSYFMEPWTYSNEYEEWFNKRDEMFDIIFREHGFDDDDESLETDQFVKQLLQPWILENPSPFVFINRITGERWGSYGDSRPVGDWRPPANERKG